MTETRPGVQRVVGIDPGPDPGLVLMVITDVAGAGRLPFAVKLTRAELDAALPTADLVSMERFVIGRGTVRRTRGGTDATLEMIGALKMRCYQLDVPLVSYSASMVKPWATDARLEAWGVSVRGDHHRDAARHALFAAVRSGLLPKRPPGDRGDVDTRQLCARVESTDTH